MAYGLKYTIPFKDIDNLANVVEIYQDGFTGSVTELIATDAPATHKYEREDNEDITTPIMSTTFTISFYSTENTDFRNFFSYSDREFLVVHKFEGNVIFKGYLLNDITGEPFQDPPYPVVVTATDGLAQLKEVALVGPSEDTELGSLIFETLNRLELELDIEVCNDLYEGLVMDNTKSIFDQAAGEQLLIQEFTFDELELNAYDFLLEICRSFGWILLQKNGRWLIQRPIARNIEGTMIYVHSYVDGSVISSYANNAFESAETWYLNSIAANPYSGIAYGNGKFVAISNGSFNLLHSNDGITWETVTVGSFGLSGIVYADGKFVAVGAQFSGADLITNVEVSTDGINWTRYTPFTNSISPKAITYGNGLFVVVGILGSNRVMTSPDGISWTIRSVLGNDDNWQSVAFGNNLFVAVANSGDDRIMYSSDGINWTGLNINLGSNAITFAEGKFTTGTNYSTDGINWTGTTISPIIPFGITYGNGIFVLVGQAGTDRIAISEDAISWTLVTAPELNGWVSVTYGDSKFVALADSGTNRSMISYSNESESLQTIADQENPNSNWIPVNSDQLLQYQRPIKKLTVTQGDLGQSVIANGEDFNESSWFLEGPYKPFDWTITPDPDTPIIQIFPNNIPAQSSYDDEQGVSWDIRFLPNGEETDQPIISKPVFLDFAGLSLDLEIDINYLTLASALGIAIKHVDSEGTTRYLGTSIVGSLNLLAWDEAYNTFVYYSTKDNDTRKFKLSSFVLPTAGFLSIELKYFGLTGSAVVTSAKIIPTFEGKKNPTEVKKIYETAREYTSLRDDKLRFSDLAITASKNWLKIGELPAIVFVEKSLASTPDIIQVPSGAVTQVNRLTDTLGSNTLDFTGGTVTGAYQRQFVADSGFTIDSVFILVSSLSGNPPPPSAQLNVSVTTISSTQRNVTITFDDYDYTGEANIQIQVFLKDSNSNDYQVSTFLLQVNSNGSITYSQTNISFENQALLGGYSPRLRDCYARNVLTIYNALSYRLEGSFRRNGNTFGNGYLGTELNYIGYTGTVKLQVIGWEYDLASRVARITFGQVPTAYVYPIN
jgi:hypothetical protein